MTQRGPMSMRAYLEGRMQANKLSQRGLCEAIGMNHNYISKVLAGKLTPPWRVVDKIADVFEDDRKMVRLIFGVEAPEKGDTEITRKISVLAKNLPAKEQRELMDYAIYLDDRAKSQGQ